MSARMTDEALARVHAFATFGGWDELVDLIAEARRARESEAVLLEALRWAEGALLDQLNLRPPDVAQAYHQRLTKIRAAIAKAGG